MKKLCLLVFLVCAAGGMLAGCQTPEAAPNHTPTADPTPTPTALPPLPTSTLPPSEIPNPTEVPIRTAAPLSADQGPLSIGDYEIEFVRGWIAEDYAILDQDLDRDAQGMLSFPIRPEQGANTLILILNLLAGSAEGFSGYVCQVVTPAGEQVPVDRIEENQGQFFWLAAVSSTDQHLLLVCPDGTWIDLVALLEAG